MRPVALDIQRWNDSEPPDGSSLRRQLEAEGYTVSEFQDAAGTKYEPHSHEMDQTHWVVSGELDFVVDGEHYRLNAGDRDFLPAQTEHAAFVPGTEPVRYLIGVKDR